mgnify:CR=1 FL=1
MALLNRVTIVGLGFIGGSLGLALRRHRLAVHVTGFSRNASTIRQAITCGAIHDGSTDVAQAVATADLVVLATPVDTIVDLAQRLAPKMRPGSILSDVGSAKGSIVRALEGRLPNRIAFVGAHPLAGSEQRGLAAARANVLEDSICVVTATARTDRRALQRVTSVWRRLGCRVVTMTPGDHDRVLAAVSHLPHWLAWCLLEATNRKALGLAPRSFLDMTRIAQSDPDLWDDIVLANREALLEAIEQFERTCRQAKHLLSRRDRRGLRRFLQRAHHRASLCHEHPAS